MTWTRPLMVFIFMMASAGLIFAQTRAVRTAHPISTNAATMRQIVNTFYQLRERTLDERGTENDVNKLLDLMSPTAIYEHPVPNVKMTVAQAREGMTAHLNEGKHAQITLGPVRTGPNFALVEVVLQYEVDGKPITKRGVTIFEFYRGRISRVAEY